jgi:type I restriction enzyme, S subunit
MMKYDTYKVSEIDWLGYVPSTWQVLRVKDITQKIGSGVTPKGGSEVYVDSGIPLLRSQNVYDDGLRIEDVSFIDEETHQKMKNSQLKPYDILINITGASIGRSCVVPESLPAANINQHIIYIRMKKSLVPYASNYFKSNALKEYINLIQAGSSKEALNMGQTLSTPILLPSHEEQTAIANYLDTKTQAIDKKVSLLEKKIGYYLELRKSLINETVTKGLDKNVKLKESGIDWIGQIPEHWEVKRIKDYTYIKARIGWQGLRSDEFELTGDYYCVTGTDFRNGQIDWSNCYHVEKERFEQDKKIIIREGDLLITKDGSIGKIAIVQSLPKPATLNSGVFVTRPKLGKYLNKYMYWLLNSNVFLDFIDLNKNGTTILHLYQNVFEIFFYCLPPIKEQIEIADYLLGKTSKIDKIIKNIQTQITTLKELRKTLINDVVTGKIKVTHRL